ncbi:MAG: cysteine--tRNA ligase [Pelagibacterales bacterium]|nr:cysteine--tRNA ligase [Pelagibacterales bacterium]
MLSKPLIVYNSLSGKKEEFKPLKKNNLGLYVCGPTVYSNIHLGNCRTFISFDIIYRYFLHKGYTVRYVRNITDVGHLEDNGEDRISKKAKVEKLEPMEIANKYTNDFRDTLKEFNALPPNIEPIASGHIIEQIEIIKKIIDKGFAYESNGSVYFNLEEFRKNYKYGKLSGREIDDLISNTRSLTKQEDKKNPYDFALWKKADSKHLMKWKSPWGDGFPGWHLECTAMSHKYLGDKFDIHGGGIDLKFPHHECEIAQSDALSNSDSINYWMHTNMLTLNNKKMSKSTGNNILPKDLISGKNKLFKNGYSSNVIRFFFLQAHYRNILDLSENALKACEKGYNKIIDASEKLKNLKENNSPDNDFDIQNWINDCYKCMNDDFNTPKLIAEIFTIVKLINKVHDGKESINSKNIKLLKNIFSVFIIDILGLSLETSSASNKDSLLDLIIELRNEARINKDYKTSDSIRDRLSKIGYNINDKD